MCRFPCALGPSPATESYLSPPLLVSAPGGSLWPPALPGKHQNPPQQGFPRRDNPTVPICTVRCPGPGLHLSRRLCVPVTSQGPLGFPPSPLL